jgi:ascorbate-specific PTS system EIIC-type component UlaA
MLLEDIKMMLSQFAQASVNLQQRESHLNRELILSICNVIFVPNSRPTSCREDFITEGHHMHSHSDIFDEILPCIFKHNFMTIPFFLLH